jgi:tetratricopeptide (TPR) repeat protein
LVVGQGVAEAVVELGGVLAAQGDVYGSEEAFRKALRADPGSAAAMRGYAGLLEEGMGDANGALEMVKKSLEVEPDHQEALCRCVCCACQWHKSPQFMPKLEVEQPTTRGGSR